MSKTKLLFDVIRYINTKRDFTAQEVADEFKVSLRTAHRYLFELSAMGIPIYTEQGRNGGYRTLKNRMLPPIIFEENEAFAIFFAFRSLHYYQSLPFTIDIGSVSRKLYASLPDDTKHKIDRLESVVVFWGQKRSVAAPHLAEIIEAAIANQLVTIEYQSKAGNSSKEVRPIGVYTVDGFWYMPAFDLAHQAVRLFRVDRIVAFTNSQQVYDTAIDLNAWLTKHEIETPVRLRADLTREGLRQCRNEPWLEPDILVNEDGTGTIDMEIDRGEIGFVAEYFFRLGIEARVREPTEAIEYIRQRAADLVDHYG